MGFYREVLIFLATDLKKEVVPGAEYRRLNVKSWGHAFLSLFVKSFWNIIIVITCNLAQAIQAMIVSYYKTFIDCACRKAPSHSSKYLHSYFPKYCFFAFGPTMQLCTEGNI